MPEINAITLLVTDMALSVRFYTDLGFGTAYGGPEATFTSLTIGSNFVNLSAGEGPPSGVWGRVIFRVDDPDAIYAMAASNGRPAEFSPRDAEWDERYFHIRDPDGHELSFARPL